MRQFRCFIFVILLATGLLTSACGTTATQAPVLQTVVQTVPVEVTRNVEVTRMVEITRDVVVTQVVELPVTVTPALPSVTPTYSNAQAQATLAVNITPQVTPQEKYQGYTPIFIQNKTTDKMDVYLAGPDEFNLVLMGWRPAKNLDARRELRVHRLDQRAGSLSREIQDRQRG